MSRRASASQSPRPRIACCRHGPGSPAASARIQPVLRRSSPKQTLQEQTCIRRNTLLREQRTYPFLDFPKRRRPQRKRLFNRRCLRPRSPNHGCPWIQILPEKATVVLAETSAIEQARLTFLGGMVWVKMRKNPVRAYVFRSPTDSGHPRRSRGSVSLKRRDDFLSMTAHYANSNVQISISSAASEPQGRGRCSTWAGHRSRNRAAEENRTSSQVRVNRTDPRGGR